MTRPARALLALAVLASSASARPADMPGPGAEYSGAKIGEIFFERLNVFDPGIKGEDWWIFRAANRIHVITRESVVRRELLVGPGDPWDPLRVLESERNLRANGSFRRAEIVPVRTSSETVNVFVHTQDAWTTNLRLSAATEGGESSYSFGFEENNLAGTGKRVTIDRGQTGGQSSTALGYGDPRFLGTRLNLNLGYARGTRGDTGQAFVTKPFFRLESTRAHSAIFTRSLTDGVVYEAGEEFSKHRESRRVVEASAGAKLNADRFFTQRVEAGWYSERLLYERLSETKPGFLPRDRELSGPTIGYAWVEPRYIKETYIDAMERVEDFNVGNQLATRLGWMGRAVGSDRDRLIYSFSDMQGWSLAPGRFVLGRVAAAGRVAGGKAENALLQAGASGFWKTGLIGDQTLVGHAEASKGRALDPQSQIVLGGGSGLRGYKNNSFVGGQAVLVNVEDRFFIPGEWLHLLRLGGAVFVDSGAVARERENLAWRAIKTDVGLGLRAAPTRSRGGTVVRVDVAYALNGGPGGSRWVLSVRAGQAFSLFNSATRSIDAAPASRLY